MVGSIKIQLPHREKRISVAIAIFVVFLLFPPNFTAVVNPVDNTDGWRTLDPSWITTLSYVNMKDFTLGSEFAFTCGPLAYLATRVGWGANKYIFLIYDLFIAFNFFAVFYITLRSSADKRLTGIWLLAMAIVLPTFFGVGISMVLLGFLIFWINKSIEKDLFYYNILQIMLIVLLLYIKFNTGLITFVFYLVAMGYKAVFRIQRLIVIAGYIVLLAAAVFASAKILNVDLPVYAAAGFELISGYNDVMGYAGDFGAEQAAAIIFIVVPGIVLLCRIIEKKEERFRTLLTLFFYGSSMFVLYKQAFVRQDLGHVLEIFKSGLFLFFCTFPLQHFRLQKYSIAISALLIAIPFWVLIRLEPAHFSPISKVHKHYISGFASFTPTSGMHLFPNNNQLPEKIKDRIGSSTVDVFPWNTHMLFENKLNYLPRPVMQAYSAYTPYLSQMNFEHFNGPDAPQYVIYDLMSIDDRYALFDNAKVNIVLIKNYRISATFDYFGRELLLLEKKPNAKPVTFEKIKEYAMYINAPLVPKEGIYYEVVPYYNLKGKALSVLQRSPRIMLVANNANGQAVYFKTSPKMLEAGFFSTKAIYNTKDFSRLAEGKGTDSIPQVEYYNLRPDDPAYFRDKIRIREYEIK